MTPPPDDADDFGRLVRPGLLARARLAVWGLLERLRPHDPNRGAWGERWAARLLQACGCKILARNVRPTRRDEIDIIAGHRGTILIVEVKTRQDEAHGRPIDAVNTNKRTHLRKAAAHWLAQNHLQNHPCRFDAIEVIGTPGHPPTLRWVQRLHMPTR